MTFAVKVRHIWHWEVREVCDRARKKVSEKVKLLKQKRLKKKNRREVHRVRHLVDWKQGGGGGGGG